MTYDAPAAALAEPKSLADTGGSVSRSEKVIFDELVEVLSAHPRGLRRWSVMRAIRANRTRRGRDISHKFEDEVEKTFRRHCADGTPARPAAGAGAHFYRPKETAGEVWAIALAAVPAATAPQPPSAEPA